MKFLKKFNELKATTYDKAGDILIHKGHTIRGENLKKHASAIQDQESQKRLDEWDARNQFLQLPFSVIEGCAYQYNSEKSWAKLGMTTAKIYNIVLQEDMMMDCVDDYASYSSGGLVLPLMISFRIDLSPFDNIKSEVLDPKTQAKYQIVKKSEVQHVTLYLEYDFVTNKIITSDSIHTYGFAFLLTRKGLRNLNKMVAHYLEKTSGEYFWELDSVDLFSYDESYNLLDYLYNYFHYTISLNLQRENSAANYADILANYDQYFLEWMAEFKKPKVYYNLFRDNFPDTIKIIE